MTVSFLEFLSGMSAAGAYWHPETAALTVDHQDAVYCTDPESVLYAFLRTDFSNNDSLNDYIRVFGVPIKSAALDCGDEELLDFLEDFGIRGKMPTTTLDGLLYETGLCQFYTLEELQGLKWNIENEMAHGKIRTKSAIDGTAVALGSLTIERWLSECDVVPQLRATTLETGKNVLSVDFLYRVRGQLTAVLGAAILSLVSRQRRIRQCPFCGTWFEAPQKSSMIYCHPGCAKAFSQRRRRERQRPGAANS